MKFIGNSNWKNKYIGVFEFLALLYAHRFYISAEFFQDILMFTHENVINVIEEAQQKIRIALFKAPK